MLTLLANWTWAAGFCIATAAYLCWKFKTGGFADAILKGDTFKKSVLGGIMLFLMYIGFSIAAVLVAYVLYGISTVALVVCSINAAQTGAVETALSAATIAAVSLVAVIYCRVTGIMNR